MARGRGLDPRTHRVLEHGSQQHRGQAYDQRRGDRCEPPPSPAGSKCNHRRKDATAGSRAGWRASGRRRRRSGPLNRPFGSLTASVKYRNCQFQSFSPALHQNSGCAFSRLSCTVDSHRVKPQSPRIGARGPLEQSRCCREVALDLGRTGNVASTLSRTTANVRDRPHKHAPPCPTETQCARPSIRIMALMRRMGRELGICDQLLGLLSTEGV